MKSIYFSALFASIFASIPALFSQKEADKPEVIYSRDGFLNQTKQLRFEVDIMNVGFQGKHFSYGIGGRFLAYHFVDKLSAEVAYNQRLAAIIPEGNSMGYSQKSNVDPFKGLEFNLAVGYSISKKEIDTKEMVSLKQTRNVITVSEFPVKVHKTFDLKLGFLIFDLPGQIEIQPNSPFITPTMHLMQNTRSITFGFSRKTMKNDSYTTDKFGKIKHSAYGEFYMDFIYGLGASFPNELFVAETINGFNYYNEKYVPVSPAVYESIKASMQYNPFGGQIGFRSGSMRHGFGFNTCVAFRPGFISQSTYGLIENLTANLTVSYHIPVLLK